MPELRRFSPSIPVVLVGTKLGEVDTIMASVIISNMRSYVLVQVQSNVGAYLHGSNFLLLQISAKTDLILLTILLLPSSLLNR